MHREGHVGAALLFYTPLGTLAMAFQFDELALVGAAVAVVLAMLPDVDMAIPGIPHRGPTHTVWFALGAGGVAGVIGALLRLGWGPLPMVGVGLFAGLTVGLTVLSHLAADALTPAGIRPLAPRDDREITLDIARASNPIANYVLLGVGLLAVGGGLGVGIRVARLL